MRVGHEAEAQRSQLQQQLEEAQEAAAAAAAAATQEHRQLLAAADADKELLASLRADQDEQAAVVSQLQAERSHLVHVLQAATQQVLGLTMVHDKQGDEAEAQAEEEPRDGNEGAGSDTDTAAATAAHSPGHSPQQQQQQLAAQAGACEADGSCRRGSERNSPGKPGSGGATHEAVVDMAQQLVAASRAAVRGQVAAAAAAAAGREELQDLQEAYADLQQRLGTLQVGWLLVLVLRVLLIQPLRLVAAHPA